MLCYRLDRRIGEGEFVDAVEGIEAHPIRADVGAKLAQAFEGFFAAPNVKKVITVADLNIQLVIFCNYITHYDS